MRNKPMWMEELSTADTASLQKAAVDCVGEEEVFLRDDAQGALIVCSGNKSPDRSAGREIKELFNGGRFGRAGGSWLFCVGLWTPEDFREEFLAWYRVEHLPMLLECLTWDGCRFVEESVPKGCQFYAMHQLADKKALDSDERKRSRATPWFKRLTKNDWFDGAFTRTLYRRVA
jgi:hypothetical protein